jgi:hypothetical protein
LTTFQYLKISKHNKKNLEQSYKSLISAFHNGKVSYPRVTNDTHESITIINKNDLIEEVIIFLNYNKEEIDQIKDNLFDNIEKYKLSNPSTIITDLKEAKKIKNKKEPDFKVSENEIKLLESVSRKIKINNFNEKIFFEEINNKKNKGIISAKIKDQFNI